MAYVSDSNLTQFWGLAKDYINAEDGRYANWQKTAKSGAVTCWPVGGTPLLPTVDFIFSETGPAEGTKGPDNPSTITGVESVKVTRCGKNLILFPYDNTSVTNNGITFTVSNDGSVAVSGTATADAFWNARFGANSIHLASDVRYTLSGCPGGGSASAYYLRMNNYNGNKDTGAGTTITVVNQKTGSISIVVKSGTVLTTPVVFRPQLEVGEQATSFEKGEGTDYTFPLGSTYYGGTLDVASGVMTVTWGSLTFSSANNVQGDNGTCVRFAHAYPVQAYTHYSSEYPDFFACEMFPVATGGPQSEEFCRAGGSGPSGSQSATFSILKSRLDVSGAADPSNPTNAEWLAAINAWLENNPITYYFKLYYPQTVQLTPLQLTALAQKDKYTPRLNTVYTDASAVQVGYAKSPIRSEYELTQAIIATEGGE